MGGGDLVSLFFTSYQNSFSKNLRTGTVPQFWNIVCNCKWNTHIGRGPEFFAVVLFGRCLFRGSNIFSWNILLKNDRWGCVSRLMNFHSNIFQEPGLSFSWPVCSFLKIFFSEENQLTKISLWSVLIVLKFATPWDIWSSDFTYCAQELVSYNPVTGEWTTLASMLVPR